MVASRAGMLSMVTLVSVIVAPGAAWAEGDDLKAVLRRLVDISPRVSASYGDLNAAEERVSETFRRAWTPNLDISTEVGSQRYASRSTEDPDYTGTNRTTMKVTQLVYDFGRSAHKVAEVEAVARQSAAAASATADGVILEALMAHWNVIRARKVLEFARQSEATITRQTQLENSLVDVGRGYESDVLQAKVQLATAEARRVRAEGALQIAEARVTAVFGGLAGNVDYNEVAFPIDSSLPRSLEEAKMTALENNKQIKLGIHRSSAIRERLDSTIAQDLLPKLQLVGENNFRNDFDGVDGRVSDRKVVLQLTYSLNMGMAAVPAAQAVRKDLSASVSREAETRDLVQEQVSIAWRNVLVARQNRDTLANQVRIAAKFLELATAERQLGRRSLLDVLSAEVALINAQSDLATTEADLAIAGLTMLQAIGKLSIDELLLQKSSELLAANAPVSDITVHW